MKVTLPDEVMKSLPEPDSQGVIRVNASLRMSPEGGVSVVEINDLPVPKEKEDEEESEETEGEEMAGETALPTADELERSLYQ